jgi:hypothetical protein
MAMVALRAAGQVALQSGKLLGRLGSVGAKSTLHFFTHEFPAQLASGSPKALAFSGLTATHLAEIGMGVVAREPATIVGGGGKVYGLKVGLHCA